MVTAVIVMLVNLNLDVVAERRVVFQEIIIEENTKCEWSLEIEENSQIAGLSINIAYDSDVLSVDSCEIGSSLEKTIYSLNNEKAGVIRLTAITTEPVVSSGSIVEIVFSGGDNSSIHYEILECIDSSCMPLEWEKINKKTEREELTTQANKQGHSEEGNGEKSDGEDVVTSESENKEIVQEKQGENAKNSKTVTGTEMADAKANGKSDETEKNKEKNKEKQVREAEKKKKGSNENKKKTSYWAVGGIGILLIIGGIFIEIRRRKRK